MALWTPAEITTFRWWRVPDAGTVIDGGLISSVADLSGNGAPLTASGTDRPGVSTINGQNAADYSPSGTVRLSTAEGVGVSPMQALYVQRKTSADSSYIIMIGGAGNPYGPAAQSGSGSTAISSSMGTPSFYLDAELQSWTTRGDVYTALQNRTSVVEIRNGAFSGVLNAGYYSSATSFSFNDLLGEIIILDADPSADDWDRLQGYLHWNWGIEAQLPAGHPYKSAAPTTGATRSFKPLLLAMR